MVGIFGGGTKGDFIGISEDGLTELKTQIQNYIITVTQDINQFNELAERLQTFRGETIVGKLGEYLVAAKKALTDYVAKLEIEKTRVDNALTEWRTGESSLGTTVESNASTIEKAAAGFNLD